MGAVLSCDWDGVLSGCFANSFSRHSMVDNIQNWKWFTLAYCDVANFSAAISVDSAGVKNRLLAVDRNQAEKDCD